MKGNRVFQSVILLLAVLSSSAEQLDCAIIQRENRMLASTISVTGEKRVLWYRLAYADDPRQPASAEAADAAMATANSILKRISFGNVSLAWSITPLLELPRTTAFYSTNIIAMLDDAKICAASLGFNSADYDRDLISPPPMAGWSQGMAVIGGRWLYVSIAHGGLIVHELGHTFGLPHANAWDTNRPDPFAKSSPPFPSNISEISGTYDFQTNSFVGRLGIMFPGTSVEYGDPFDIMATSDTNADFNVNFKSRLGWISSDAITRVSSSGTYRIYNQRATTTGLDRPCAISIEKLVVGRHADHVPRMYWIETAPKTANGALLRWIDANNNQPTLLLDSLPGSFDGFTDAALGIGRAFDDPGLGLSITPVAYGAEWIDVAIDFNAGAKAAANAPVPPMFPTDLKITGRVIDTSGHPLPNCRVHTGRIIRRVGDRGDFDSELTDTNGFYSLPVFDASQPFTIGASIYGYKAVGGIDEQTVTVPASGVASNVNFTFEPLPRITITAPQQLIEGQSSVFKISRTGDTTAPMEVSWQTTGTADFFDYTGPSGIGSVTIPAGSASTTLPITAGLSDGIAPAKTITLHAIISSSMQRGEVTYFYPGWELRNASDEQNWFQTDPPYATFADAEATIELLDTADPSANRVELANFGATMALQIFAPIGRAVRVEISSDLRNWQIIATNTVTTSPFSFPLPLGSQSARFYRTETQP